MMLAPRPTACGEFLHLRVVHVLAEVRADQHNALCVFNVGPLRRSDVVAVGEREADIARAAALRERWSGDIVCTVGSQRVLEEGAAKTVDESRQWTRDHTSTLIFCIFSAMKLSASSQVTAFHSLLAAFAYANQRRAQTVRIEVRADSTGTARAKPSAGKRIERIAFNLPELTVAHAGDGAALPEADIAEGGNGANA